MIDFRSPVRSWVVVQTLIFALLRLAHADAPSPPTKSDAPPAQLSVPQPAAPTPTTGADMNFDLFDEKKVSPAEKAAGDKQLAEITKKVKLRRNLLQAHQAFGFATLALLAATVVLGQLNYQDKFASGGDYTQKYDLPHYVLSIAATTSFTTTAALALFAPNPYPKPVKFDTALIHKITMALAAACFVTEIILGPVSAQIEPGKLDQRVLAQTHLGLGYSALGLMAVGTLVYVF